MDFIPYGSVQIEKQPDPDNELRVEVREVGGWRTVWEGNAEFMAEQVKEMVERKPLDDRSIPLLPHLRTR